MWKQVAVFSALVWLLTLGGVGYVFIHGHTRPTEDRRLAVEVSAAERNFVLAEMREMLAAIHTITAAMAQKDRKRKII